MPGLHAEPPPPRAAPPAPYLPAGARTVRFIGCKSRLLGAIEGLLHARGVRGGTLLDVFSGTAVLARHFRARGWRVLANDRLRLSYVLQAAVLEVEGSPPDLVAHWRAIERAPDVEGVVTRHYSPEGAAGRWFFRPQHARRIDAALEYLAAARAAGAISAGAFKLLLAGVVCGADRVANICGTYGAFLKRWQPNTAGPFALVLPLPPAGPLGRAHCEDANQLVRRLEQPLDVLYIDPPYNGREYCANYHVLEVIARRPFLDAAALRRLEASIYGKTGLVPYERSRYCRRRQVAAALAELVAAAPARHVVVSYSEEGLLGAEEIRQALARGLGVAPSAIEHHRLSLRRFRSDADGRSARLDGERRTRPRRYRQLEGRGRDELQEWLFYARRPLAAAGRTA